MEALRQLLFNAPALGAFLGLMSGAIAFFALGLHSRQRLELRSAMAWVNGIKWRDFLRMAVSMLNTRGLEMDPTERQPGDDGFDLLMRRGSARYIVQCKHGRSYRFSPSSAQQLSTAMNLHGAEGGIVITAGTPDALARSLAASGRVELIDGASLWNQLKPLVADNDKERIHGQAEALRNRRLGAVCGIALAGGLAGFVLAGLFAGSGSSPDPSTARQNLSRPAPVQPAQPTATAASGDSASLPGALIAPEEATTPEAQIQASREAALALQQISQLGEEALEARRQEAAKLAATVFGVESAAWQTKSTLVLRLLRERLDDPDGVTAQACTHLVRFEELRYTRLQLEPASDQDDVRIRWRQCR